MFNVFLDTQVYQSKKFDFENNHLLKFLEYIEIGIVNLFITTVTRNEIECKIKEKVEDSRQYINKFKSQAGILKNYDLYKPIWDDQTINDAETKILDNFKEFLIKYKVEEIPISDECTNEIFQKYFNGQPPFSSKKKDEFPDAFALYSLSNWAKINNEIIYVVSDDKDLKAYCEDNEDMIYIKSLENALDYINKHENEVRYELVKRLYDEQQYEFLNYINVEDLDIDVNDLVEDVEINSLYVNSVDDDPLVLELNENKLTIVFNVVIDIHITVSSVDPTRSPYDSEDKKYLFIKYEEEEHEDTIRIPVELQLDIKDYQNQQYTIESVLLNNGNTFYYSII
ncbi:PIN domain-containing protein [Bacillus halotolerans]|uniref:PIN domain-containing protein n=1 Tax=Bacillus halotolerans TaxID=260554 RepID=UPI003305A94C